MTKNIWIVRSLLGYDTDRDPGSDLDMCECRTCVAGHHSPLLGHTGHVDTMREDRSSAHHPMLAAPQMASKSPSTQEGHHSTGHNTAHCSVSDQHYTRSHVTLHISSVHHKYDQHLVTTQLVLSSKTLRSQIFYENELIC